MLVDPKDSSTLSDVGLNRVDAGHHDPHHHLLLPHLWYWHIAFHLTNTGGVCTAITLNASFWSQTFLTAPGGLRAHQTSGL